ncbi:hypothetical protein [Lacticaseibacillus nasuensis]|uniref:hypothetical protein n=1 Tax=Lacticaseibacillus nasuensis TaxID=944671 RepID=UPI0006CF4392|nr:hypothetical protein [Lacticaseibacillus nasuensis]
MVFLGYNFGIKTAEAKSKSIEQMAQDHKVAPFTNQHNPSQTGKSIFPYFSPDSPVCGAYCTDFLKFLPKDSHSDQYEMTGAPTPVATDLDNYIEKHPGMIAANIAGLETELKKGLGVPDTFILVLMHANLVSFIPSLKKSFPNALIYQKYPHYRAFTTGYEDFPAMMKKPVQELTTSITNYIKDLPEDAL